MKEPSLPFDHQPDQELGAALRVALEAGDQATFVARVLTRIDLVRAGRRAMPTWEVLARWSRTGIAAAAAAALLAGFMIGRAMQTPVAIEEVAVAGEGATALMSSPRAPDASVVFTAIVNRQR